MLGYDYRVPPGQTIGTPLPGMLAGRWWTWHSTQLWPDPGPAMDAYANELLHPTQTDVPLTSPARQRMALLDTEGHDPVGNPLLIPRCLDALQRRLPCKVIIIGDWWPGYPADWSFQRVVAALEGKASRDRTAMFALARQHRPIVAKAGIAAALSVVDDPGQFDFFVRKAVCLGKFLREAYSGTEICAWLCGAYVRTGNELSQDHCQRLCDAVWEHYDSLCLYGSLPHTDRLGQVLAGRLMK